MKFSSSIISLLSQGKILDVLTPWSIFLDLENELIVVSKRNWFLIGVDSQTAQFKYIRNIKIDQHFFGADIHIKAMGSSISAMNLEKSAAKKIRLALLEFNQRRKGKGIIIS
ncbi:MAG: hypothetical protein ACXITV_12355 [Luteibaculaceae bacterium]